MLNPNQIEVGKTYDIDHSRKGKWRATVIANDGVWLTLSDDPSSPVRISLLSATLVK